MNKQKRRTARREKIFYAMIALGFIGLVALVFYTIADFVLRKNVQRLIVVICMLAILFCVIIVQNLIFRAEVAISEKQKNELEELNRAQNSFFSSMSHEIRTPINTIIGLNEMILREDVSDEVAADAQHIQSASKMLLALINDILDMSKIESGKMDIVPVQYDVGAMLSDIVNMIWVRAKEKGLEFHINVDPAMPSQLFGDEVRIKQILINILNNAVKYTMEGSVTLSIQGKKIENGKVLVTYSVADTGIGIKQEQIPHLFDTFRRVDQEKNRYIEGTGLGLSIVKQLVGLMDGDIAVNSIYTKGSTFVVTLPQEIVEDAALGRLDLETRHELNARKHYKQSFEAPNARVLIVDDNETNLLVEEKLLRDTKVQIDTASSGDECLNKSLHSRYDVILMDHLMPKMDGIECLHKLREQIGGLNQNTPVVILTANAGSENQALYSREGFDGYLLKPVSGAQLEAEVLKHLPDTLVIKSSVSDTAETENAPVIMHKQKLPVMITTDSLCDLPKNAAEKYHIAVVPYKIITEGGEFFDKVEAQTDGLTSYMESGKCTRSQAPSRDEYGEFFANQLINAQYIIHISAAKNVSNGYENATQAAKMFDNVRVIDSGNLSCGMGMVAVFAAQLAAEGKSVDDIISQVAKIRRFVKTSFIVDSTEYLARTGRISAKTNRLCAVFMLHPVLTLRKSTMVIQSIKIGTRTNARKKYIKSALSHTRGRIDSRILFIVHAGLTNDELNEIENETKNRATFDTVIRLKASSAILANTGPKTFGLMFMLSH